MNLSNKFQGCLVGGLLGDCLGAPFEGDHHPEKSVLNSYFKKMKKMADPKLKGPDKKYTDDSAMTMCIAQSLIEKKDFDISDITKRFVREYYSSLYPRGYGRSVAEVFAALNITNFEDVFAPAAAQFNGTGSYGNGAAMRVSPVALFCCSDPVDKVVDLAKQSALVTHSNRLGYNGAILQCLAIHEILQQKDTLNSHEFLEVLISRMREIETFKEEEIIDGNRENEFVYVSALQKVRHLLEKGNDVSVDDVKVTLGNDISAHGSVPTAIYVFLRAQLPIAGVKTDNAFQRTVHYAISLGGDTDTIAAMAGNIAGAYYGLDAIPMFLQKRCEAIDEMKKLADEMYALKGQSAT